MSFTYSGMDLECQIRYRGEIKKITIKEINHEEKTATIKFLEPDASIAEGQSVVFYTGKECLGGGVFA